MQTEALPRKPILRHLGAVDGPEVPNIRKSRMSFIGAVKRGVRICQVKDRPLIKRKGPVDAGPFKEYQNIIKIFLSKRLLEFAVNL
jgi:hypothetical protein